MINDDFSITFNLLENLSSHNQRAGLLHSLVVVHISGGAATAVTTTLDTLLHLISGITKVATGIFATPIAYFTGSHTAKKWSWSSAGVHFLQATKHSLGIFTIPIITFLFSPKAACNIFFPENVIIRNQKIELDILRQDNASSEVNIKKANGNFQAEQKKVGELKSKLKSNKTEMQALKQKLASLQQEKNGLESQLRKKSDQLEANQKLLTAKQKANGKAPELSEDLLIAIDSLAEELLCPIDYMLMEDAVFLSPCGHKFNKDSIQPNTKCCPSCRTETKAAHTDHLISNVAKKMMEIRTVLDEMGVQLNALS